MIDLEVNSRIYDNKRNFEVESPFTSKFQLTDKFTKKYEYFMEGKVSEIQKELQLLHNRLEDYISKFKNKIDKDAFT